MRILFLIHLLILKKIKSLKNIAGTVKYKYDKNDNLRFSQDNNQANKTEDSKYISFRGYDGLNRLLYIGVAYNESYFNYWGDLNPDVTNSFEDFNNTPNSFLTVNVYDTMINYPANTGSVFSVIPDDYYSAIHNNTKGSLCATAYRTLETDGWNYKYYRYDARGRVIKMWNIIDGFTSTIDYEYNSANQIIRMVHNDDNSNNKDFRYTYDLAGRMKSTGYYDGNTVNEFTGYSYNRNSQIDTHRLGNNILTNLYSYNSRNWVTDYTGNKINYSLIYLQNGNIATQIVSGDYKLNFANTGNIRMYYTYDKSNRLLTTESDTKPANYQFTGTNTYDYDGNLLSLTRSSNGDNFSYTYITGTNRLRSINTNPNLYQYDYNGNMISDGTRTIFDVVYDYRNLIIEFKRKLTKQEETIVYRYQYRYDESGNRIEKITDMQKEETWVNIDKEYYIRDVSGKEIAVHTKLENADWLLSFYNIWGLSNEGQMLPDGTKYYYLKDHLGSIRAVYDQNLNLISAVDLDAWGYELTNRTYNDTNKYKFTTKERDKESSYDYFGTRYYDSRVANWNAPDPLMEKHLQWSPYNYVLRNPLILIDPNGKQIYVFGNNAKDIIDSWDKEWADYDVNTHQLIEKKEYQNELINPSDENYEIRNFIRKPNGVANIFSLEAPKIDETHYFMGDAWGGSGKDPLTDKLFHIQYVYLPHFQRMSSLLIMSLNKSISHLIIESMKGAQTVGTKNYDYDKAHKETIELVGGVNTLWWEFFEGLIKGDFSNTGYYDLRNNRETKVILKYNVKTKEILEP